MIARIRKQAPWWAIGLVLILPALGGGFSLLCGWPQASVIFTIILAIMLTHPDEPRRLPWWYWTLGAGLAVLALLWLWPGPSLIFLSPTRANWPGPSGEISGIAANRVGTFESLFQALGFYAVLGIALLALDRPARRRSLMRWMLVCLGSVFASALLIHFFHMNSHILPDLPVLFWDRLNYPFTGANLAAAFFVSSLPFAAGMCLVFSPEERYMPIRRVWQVIGMVAFLCMLALQMMTKNRWMWVSLAPFLLGG
ncbi:MAG TPA: hypothetical protein VL860_00655, partial [Planctomycetota bacterium]|nr:hypothetical protein [Planctomycetota bacterium]